MLWKAFQILSPASSVGIVIFSGAFSIVMMSSAACTKYSQRLALGKGILKGKKVIVSQVLIALVLGM